MSQFLNHHVISSLKSVILSQQITHAVMRCRFISYCSITKCVPSKDSYPPCQHTNNILVGSDSLHVNPLHVWLFFFSFLLVDVCLFSTQLECQTVSIQVRTNLSLPKVISRQQKSPQVREETTPWYVVQHDVVIS